MNIQSSGRVQRSFSRSFRTYHDAACQQAQIADQLVQDLLSNGARKQFTSVLEFGCGTGHLTQRLWTTFDVKGLIVNDLSPEAAETAASFDAEFLCGDAEAIVWPSQPDLIASASMIQWLPDPVAFLRRAANALAPGGWLAVSGFGPEQYQELVHIGPSAKAPGLCKASDLASAIADQMEVLTVGEAERQMRFNSPRDVLKHLRKTGVNGRAQTAWTKSSLQRFTDDYTHLFGDSNGVPLTYHPIWIVARKRG